MLEFEKLQPMLLDERPLDLDEPGWIYELKYDGYRLLAEFGGGQGRLQTRKGADATRWFPEVTESLAAIPGGPYITDGEVCVLDEYGRSDFDALQDRARRRRWYAGARPVAYCIFDLLVDRDADITGRPLAKRQIALDRLLKVPLPNVLRVGHFTEGGRQLFDQAVMQLKLGAVSAWPEGVTDSNPVAPPAPWHQTWHRASKMLSRLRFSLPPFPPRTIPEPP